MKINKYTKEEDKVNRILLSGISYLDWMKRIVKNMEEQKNKERNQDG